MAIDPNNAVQSAPDQVPTESAPIPDTLSPTEMPAMRQAPPPAELSQPVPVAAPVDPLFAEEKKHSAFGKFARSLFTGEDVSYGYDDQGNMQTTRTPQKPGQLFRSLLAGALLGGAMGAEDPTHTFAGGMVRGAAGVQKDKERQDEMKRKQAVMDYETRLKGREAGRKDEELDLARAKEEREERELKSKEDLNRANIGLISAQKYGIVTEASGKSIKYHDDLVKSDAPTVDTYREMGLAPVQTGVLESEMQKLIASRPDTIGKLDWRVVGQRFSAGADGYPKWEFILNGYDVGDKSVPISQGQINEWKKVMGKIYPDVFERLKAGTKMAPEDYRGMVSRYNAQHLQQSAEEKEAGDMAYKKAVTDEAIARAAALRISSAKESKDQAKVKAIEAANAALEKAGGNYDALDFGTRRLLAESDANLLPELTRAYGSLMSNPATNPNDPQLRELAQNIEAISMQVAKARRSVPAAVDASKLPKPGKATSVESAEGLQAYTIYKAAYGGDGVAAAAAMVQNGWTMGTPAAANESAVSKVAGAISGTELGKSVGSAARALKTIGENVPAAVKGRFQPPSF